MGENPLQTQEAPRAPAPFKPLAPQVPRCSLLLRQPEHRALQCKERGPKKEEMRVHPTSRRQKEITEPFVLTVAKPLPQKGERKTLCTAR